MTSKKDKIIGLGRLCTFDRKCQEHNPCKRCLEIGMTAKDKAVFTPAQEKEINDWLNKNKDLMDSLAELEEKEKLTNGQS
jgi:hypothetical protein